MINELKNGDRVEFTRALVCPSDCHTRAHHGDTGRVESSCSGQDSLYVRRDRGGSVFLFNSPHYDLTGCVRKITKTKELTVEQISKELGYDIKVVKG